MAKPTQYNKMSTLIGMHRLFYVCYLYINFNPSNYIHYVWNKGAYPFPNFKGTSIEVWEGIINFIPQFTLCVTT